MKILISIIPIVLIGAAIWSQTLSNVEQARYSILKKSGDIEIREYTPHIVAEAVTTGDRKTAINRGFEIIADYIFGNNTAKSKIAMTAPVMQQSNEKIAMTAPVIQQEGQNGEWTVQFIMPEKYTLETLPKPNNEAVKLREIPARRYVAIRFSGNVDDQMLKSRQTELEAFVAAEKLETLGTPQYAFYNPPFTLPFLKRNEVMVEVK